MLSHKSTNILSIINRMYKDITKNNGGTYSLIGQPKPLSGYMVSIGCEKKIAVSSFTPEDITRFIGDYSDRLFNLSGFFLGAWYDNGYMYLDVSIHFYYLEGAMNVGRRYNQIAIWDIVAGESIPVK